MRYLIKGIPSNTGKIFASIEVVDLSIDSCFKKPINFHEHDIDTIVYLWENRKELKMSWKLNFCVFFLGFANFVTALVASILKTIRCMPSFHFSFSLTCFPVSCHVRHTVVNALFYSPFTAYCCWNFLVRKCKWM